MKSRPIYLVLLALNLVSAVQTFSQTDFVFNNYVPSVALDAPVFDANGNRLFGTNFVAVLYGGPTADSLSIAQAGNSSMDPVPFLRIQNGEAGYFGMGGSVIVYGVPSGGYAWLRVKAWDVRLGSTYDDVAALGVGGYGESPLFYTYGGDPGTATGRPPQPLRGLQSFSLVPEPSTWALLGVGVGFLFWRWRRRK